MKERRLLHLVRRGAKPPAAAVAPHDRVVYTDEIDGQRLLDYIFAADTVVVW